MKNLSIERTIEKDKYCHGFSILGGESEQFMHFTSQRGKYNDPNCAETIKRNFLIINKNVSTIAQFFERQSKWLDQINAYSMEEEIDSDPHCERCFKHCPPYTMLKGANRLTSNVKKVTYNY